MHNVFLSRLKYVLTSVTLSVYCLFVGRKVAVPILFRYSSICNTGIVKDDLKRFTEDVRIFAFGSSLERK